MFLILLVQIAWTLCNSASNIWLSRWSELHQKITILNETGLPSNG
jgi:hypothetical protein